jgi:cold shock CspA family protein/ribosome-associated translation inhibitor RaiA
MELPIQITSRNFKLFQDVEDKIRSEAEKLDKFYDRIISCRIVVESPHRHSRQGKQFLIKIHLTLPGGDLVIKREPNEDIKVSIRDSFSAARRKLEDYARKQRGDIKRHEETPQASITSLFPELGYGFLTTPQNIEVYFHENSVVNTDFNKLKVGMRVRYEETKGEKGPQASTVAII